MSALETRTLEAMRIASEADDVDDYATALARISRLRHSNRLQSTNWGGHAGGVDEPDSDEEPDSDDEVEPSATASQVGDGTRTEDVGPI